MRIAVAGKGGAGKTTITATLARLAAASGHPTTCIDADSNPNLAVALGVDDAPDRGLAVDLVSRRLDGGAALTTTLDEVFAAHAVRGPDGVRLVHMGHPAHAEEGCLCSAHGVVRALLADLADAPGMAFVDMEASPEHFSRGTARHVDVLVFVAEPYFRSLETVRRMAALARELPIPRIVVVGNKLRDEQDVETLRAFADRHDLDLVGMVPWDDHVIDADRARVPLVEAMPHGPATEAISRLLAVLVRDPS